MLARIAHGCLIWFLIAVSILFMFKKTGRWGAIACGAYYIAMSNKLGFWAMWYDLAVAPVYLAAYFVIISKRIPFNVRLFFIGLLTGVGFLIKQHAALIFVVVFIALMMQKIEKQDVLKVYIKPFIISVSGLLLPILAYLIYYFLITDEWYALWYWMIWFNLAGDYSILGQKLPTLRDIRAILPAFLMIVPFIVMMGAPQEKTQKKVINEQRWLLLFLALTTVMLFPRYSTMHWATMAPFLAIASGWVCAELLTNNTRGHRSQVYLRWGIYVAVVGLLWIGDGVLVYRTAYLERHSRILIEFDSLPELTESITKAGDLGEVLLFPDDEGVGNLYYLLQKTPPGYWLMNYPWFQNSYEINQWLEKVEANKPDHIIYFADRGPQMYPQFNAYILMNYQTVKVLEWNNQFVEIKQLIKN